MSKVTSFSAKPVLEIVPAWCPPCPASITIRLTESGRTERFASVGGVRGTGGSAVGCSTRWCAVAAFALVALLDDALPLAITKNEIASTAGAVMSEAQRRTCHRRRLRRTFAAGFSRLVWITSRTIRRLALSKLLMNVNSVLPYPNKRTGRRKRGYATEYKATSVEGVPKSPRIGQLFRQYRDYVTVADFSATNLAVERPRRE